MAATIAVTQNPYFYTIEAMSCRQLQKHLDIILLGWAI